MDAKVITKSSGLKYNFSLNFKISSLDIFLGEFCNFKFPVTKSLDGLIRNIPDFYKSVAENHFEEMGSMYKFLEHDLLMSIEENVKFIKYHYDK